MRRQTFAGEAFADAGRLPRLDPFALPVRYAVPPAGRPPGAATGAEIDRDHIVIDRRAPGGMLRETVPVRAYRGIAARMVAAQGGGRLMVVIELCHADPNLSLPLAEAEDPAEIIADWQAWGMALRLPLLIVAADGSIVDAMPRLGSVRTAAPKPRRRHSYFADRRPRFLVRRKVGRTGPAERIAADEIIARD